MKRLLIATAVIEAGAGVALISIPSSVTTFVLQLVLATVDAKEAG